MSEECTDGACAVDYTKEDEPKNKFNREYITPTLGLVFLLCGISFNFFDVVFFTDPVPLIWFSLIYFTIGGPIVLKAIKLIFKGDIYNEFVLMSVATLGAFGIGAFEEGVAVMIFYVIGELFQESAVKKAKRSIEALLKVQADEVTVKEGNTFVIKTPKNIKIGQIIQIKAGEKIALDGILATDFAQINTAALTGESVPQSLKKGESVLAGMINLGAVIEVEVTHSFEDTKLSKILQMVQEAVGRKAKTQQLISRLAKVYTPIVFWLAFSLVLLPFFFLGEDYQFQTWFQRALIFLVISCPCALVISIPLGYFGGIGAGSRNGILFKGSNYLDLITNVDTIVMDKTGTLTEGVFEVQEVHSPTMDATDLINLVGELEKNSTHPIAEAIVRNITKKTNGFTVEKVEEIAGLGLKGTVDGKELLAGNMKLMKEFNISVDEKLDDINDTIVFIALGEKFIGYITIADKIKKDAKEAILRLHGFKNIKEIIMLSGDKQSVVDQVSKEIGIDRAIGELLPEGKMKKVEELKAKGRIIAFTGDGINDAPVITLSDVGIAMGGLGSDAAIESADIIIQTDQPSKIATAIQIGNATKRIIWQNIYLALGVKILVLILGAFGMATMWEAVIADVGVALLAILNAVRIQRMKF